MSTLLLSVIAFCSTCAGGLVALWQRARFQLIVAFTAGTLIGLAAFEWLPQLFQSLALLPTERFAAFVALAAGFFTFHILDKIAASWQRWDRPGEAGQSLIGIISVLLFSLHRIVEGATIGVSFQLNLAIGLVIASALILHNLVEGLNAVTLLLSNQSTRRQALVWLILFACTPLLGLWLTAWLPMPTNLLPRYLGFFSGFLLYMGAGHLLPEIQREEGLLPLLCTLAGALCALALASLLILV